MLQQVNLKPTDKVLEIGAGSGYMAALLARRSLQVASMEIHPQLAAMARANLQKAGIANARVIEGDGSHGLPSDAPFDAGAVQLQQVLAAVVGEAAGGVLQGVGGRAGPAQLAHGQRAHVDAQRQGQRCRRAGGGFALGALVVDQDAPRGQAC